METKHGKREEEYSFISDKGEIGFIDYDDDKSVCSYIPEEEGPVIVSVPFPLIDEKPRSILIGETASDQISIRNTTSAPVELWNVNIYDSSPKDSFTVSLMEPPSKTSDVEYIQCFLESFCLEDRVLQPGQTLTVWLSCKPKQIGLHTTAVHFDVGDDRIERVVLLLVEDKISQSLASNKPYRRDSKKKLLVSHSSVVDAYVPGVRPPKASNQRFRNRIPLYPIPNDIREVVENGKIPDVITEGLFRGNYYQYFQALLIMEEIKTEEVMRGYDMVNASLRRKGQFLTLEVPGLAEKRPSLIHGDFIYAKLASEDATAAYQGHIHRIEAQEVHLKFDKDFHWQHKAGNLYNVQFNYNRIVMRKLYQAVQAVENLESEFVFPFEYSRKRQIRPTRLASLSPVLNDEQKRAVEMILGCKGGPPYVIHGPPGTGKTMTLIEAILQLYKAQNHARILVCAPSNSAADHILEKLLSETAVEVKENEIFRLNATCRPFDLKPELDRFCLFDDSNFLCPQLRDLIHYRIIISTYMSASLLYAEGIKRNHFSHIFLDEAGQASEPETMVPLSNLSNRGTVVVLAGDPMQLGPVIHSREAEEFGMGMSYLARLFEYEFYAKGNENYVTMLVRNYRCHPEILSLPSELFYNGELIASKDDIDSSIASAWVDLLPNKEFPVFYIGIQGCDEREGSNPSWFNRFEASKVVEIIKKLTEGGLRAEDIGVITPYLQQVLKINKALESEGCADIKVGSVERFQGQERQVIIISTVRSTIRHNDFDKTHCLGFLTNPRRFNVAITRARSLLIVIGNPHIICMDKYWNRLLWRCVDNDSYDYQGCPLPERQNYPPKDPPQESAVGYQQDFLDRSNEVEHGETFRAEKFSKGYEEDFCEPSDEVEHEETFPTEEFPRPDYDETNWADGWNS